MFDDSAGFRCAFCGEVNEVDVDLSAGRRQSYVEDCQVCCRPNVVRVRFDSEGRAAIDAEPES
jgi:Cysteine-rich CPXCG